jgi:hypothetical protein
MTTTKYPNIKIATTGAPVAMQTEVNGEWQVGRFASMAAILELAMAPIPRRNNDADAIYGLANRTMHKKQIARGMTKQDWFGVPSGQGDEVITALIDGYQPGVELVEQLLATMPDDLAPPADARRRRVWGDFGDSVDMQRVYGGQLDRAFQRPRRQATRAPRIVKLMVACNAGWEQLARTVAWRGAAAVALAHKLTAAGYAVEIVGSFTSEMVHPNAPAPHLHLEVMLKQAGAPLDMSTLCGALTVLGFSRYVNFAVRRHSNYKVSTTYGVPTAPEKTPFWRPDYVAGFQECRCAASAAFFVAAKLAKIQAP